MSQFILASQSPRRKALLEQLGYVFSCQPADIDESVQLNESPQDYVSRLAMEKAKFIAENQKDTTIVIGSDTSVIFQNHILGKPKNLEQCLAYLTMLSGQQHQVLTAVSLVQGAFIDTRLVSTTVRFKPLSTQEIELYWQSGEPQDKAGGYGIQGLGAQFVEHIDGCYFSVMGLPLFETSQMLANVGVYNPVNQIN